jgi:hypothetical protein
MVKSTSHLFFFILLFSTVPFYLFAQENNSSEKKSTETVEQTDAQPNQTPDIQNGELKLLLDKIEIIGELEKPQAVFIIPGNNPEIDDIRIKRSFFNNIFRQVERKGRIISKIQTKPTQNRKDYIPW